MTYSLFSRSMQIGVLAIITLLALSACSDDPLSDEAQLRALLERAETQAEDRQTSDLMELVDDSFAGKQRYDKQQLEKLLRLYFFRHKNIYLFTRISDIELTAADHAVVTVFVAMAGTAISDIAAIASLRANVYRFDLEFIKADDWLLSAADWQVANVEDLQ